MLGLDKRQQTLGVMMHIEGGWTLILAEFAKRTAHIYRLAQMSMSVPLGCILLQPMAHRLIKEVRQGSYQVA